MEITGKIIKILPEESGEGRNGPWKKQKFVIETQEQYPKKIAIDIWGDKIDLKGFGENEIVTASINIESREWNERWFTDVKAWRLIKSQPEGDSPQDTSNIPPDNTPPPESSDDTFNDLPF